MFDLILGTATFGNAYGIANRNLELGHDSIKDIVAKAQSLEINHFDTAPAYGAAEILLGNFLDQKSKPRISSKISKENAISVKLMVASVKETLERTQVSKLENLYLHSPEALLAPEASETIAGLKELLSMNLVDRVGISTYSLYSILKAKELFPELSVFQVPENICDRRLLNSADLLDLHNQGDQIIVRSVFLQGLLLMPLNKIPSKFDGVRNALSQLCAYAETCDVSVLDICLGYAKAIPWSNGTVIGVASVQQLNQVVESDFQFPENWDFSIDILPENVLDPRKW